jgi:hypothetical protein
MYYLILRENKTTTISDMLHLKIMQVEEEVFQILTFLHIFPIYLKISLEKVLVEEVEDLENQIIEDLI